MHAFDHLLNVTDCPIAPTITNNIKKSHIKHSFNTLFYINKILY